MTPKQHYYFDEGMVIFMVIILSPFLIPIALLALSVWCIGSTKIKLCGPWPSIGDTYHD